MPTQAPAPPSPHAARSGCSWRRRRRATPHLLGRIGHQQLGRQRAGLDPPAGRIRRQDHRHAVVHAHGRVRVGDDQRVGVRDLARGRVLRLGPQAGHEERPPVRHAVVGPGRHALLAGRLLRLPEAARRDRGSAGAGRPSTARCRACRTGRCSAGRAAAPSPPAAPGSTAPRTRPAGHRRLGRRIRPALLDADPVPRRELRQVGQRELHGAGDVEDRLVAVAEIVRVAHWICLAERPLRVTRAKQP